MEYAPSVQYDVGKIMYIGGGQGPPSNAVRMIDLNQPNPAWQDAKKNMAIPRRQHNGGPSCPMELSWLRVAQWEAADQTTVSTILRPASPFTRLSCGILPRESGRRWPMKPLIVATTQRPFCCRMPVS